MPTLGKKVHQVVSTQPSPGTKASTPAAGAHVLHVWSTPVGLQNKQRPFTFVCRHWVPQDSHTKTDVSYSACFSLVCHADVLFLRGMKAALRVFKGQTDEGDEAS